MAASEERGELERAFHRDLSFNNWPFLVFLALLSLLLGGVPLYLGDVKSAVVGFLVPIVPAALWLGLIIGAELFAAAGLHAIHRNGVVWRKGPVTGFVPWRRLAGVKVKHHDFDGVPVTQRFLHVHGSKLRIVVPDDEAHARIEAGIRAALPAHLR